MLASRGTQPKMGTVSDYQDVPTFLCIHFYSRTECDQCVNYCSCTVTGDQTCQYCMTGTQQKNIGAVTWHTRLIRGACYTEFF